MENKGTPGRPPIADRAMSSAERMRRSYKRKKKAGLVDIRVTIPEYQRNVIPLIAAASGYSTSSEFLTELLSDGLLRSYAKCRDQIDRAHTAKLIGIKPEAIRKVLQGEITTLLKGSEAEGWRLNDELL